MNLHEKHKPRFTVAQRRRFAAWGIGVGVAVLVIWVAVGC